MDANNDYAVLTILDLIDWQLCSTTPALELARPVCVLK